MVAPSVICEPKFRREVPMNLREVAIKDSYRTSIDAIPRDFYIPLLSRALSYDRAVGFFSSSILGKIHTGISALANRGGRIRIVASPRLTEDDVTSIKLGYKMRDTIVREAIIRELKEPINPLEANCLNQLANLIANNVLDIKIAITENDNRIGMYHEKLGLIYDSEGNTVAFSGSMNESLTAVSLNYESIDVFCSWKSEEQKARVEDKKNAFHEIWRNNEPGISVIEFPELAEEIIQRYRRTRIGFYEDYHDDPQGVVAGDPPDIPVSRAGRVSIPADVKLHDYQIAAIDEWEKNGFIGIFDMATGTGKTYTALGALARLCGAVDGKLASIIVCPFQHLVEQWVEDLVRFGIQPIIGYSASVQKDWELQLETAILRQKLNVKDSGFLCFITTNATFSLPKTQRLIEKIRSEVLVLIDEAHNFGAEYLRNKLSNKYRYRLALSATLERYNDVEGTEALISYFGKKAIEYDLERAIREKKLVRYKYYPIITTLNEEELKQYEQLSYEIGKCLIFDNTGRPKLNMKGKLLALKRARLVAGTSDKLVKLEEQIAPYIDSKHILVYCGATTIMQDDSDFSEPDEEDIRQIDAVTMLLGHKLGMRVAQFTSREDVQKRERLKREFAAGEALQALVAIKCLDEGVNIPAIRTAFILASTTNPKEYIQRRGRVLRIDGKKDFAVIFDFLTLPRKLAEVHHLTVGQRERELTLVKKEINRAEEFTRLAMNMPQADLVIQEIKDAYSISECGDFIKEDYSNA